jgi:hypothetical protein
VVNVFAVHLNTSGRVLMLCHFVYAHVNQGCPGFSTRHLIKPNNGEKNGSTITGESSGKIEDADG